ncbi:hypothetical protein ACK8P5_13645 [Paenibacillus sp. EC2-1]|uniref:hypothetical protein n=1 Tax=Paenibacillus sp. EC2-1 TaxID=3388665 RepID=UPI003BEEBA22
MLEQDNNQDAWIMKMKSKANSIHPPDDLKRRVFEQINMKNEIGEVIATVRIDSFQEENPLDSILRDLKPGMGKAIYVADQGERSVNQQTNYEAITWSQNLNDLIKLATPWQLYFPVDSELLNIHVYYGFDNLTDQEIDQMIIESQKTGKNIIIKDLRPNNVLVGMKLHYKLEENSFEFRIFGTTKSRIHVPNIEQHTIEHLKIRGYDAVYIADGEKQQLIWAEETIPGNPLQYELLAERSNRTSLVKIAESLSTSV